MLLKACLCGTGAVVALSFPMRRVASSNLACRNSPILEKITVVVNISVILLRVGPREARSAFVSESARREFESCGHLFWKKLTVVV
jgi:hypothetical protein